MADLILILVSTVLVNNFVLVRFLGLCPFLGVSRNLEAAFGMSLATTFVLTLSSAVAWILHEYLLVPLSLEYLRTISFILVIAASVQFTEIMVRRVSPLLHQLLGIYIPLIATNCAVLGVALLNVQEADGLFQSIFYGLGAAGGFALVLVLFAAMRERVQAADVPRAFRGTAIALVTAGIMSMAFMGFFRNGTTLMWSAIATAVLMIAGLALLAGLLLGFAHRRLPEDPDAVIEQVNAVLPQTQCAQCGYPGCRPYAEAIVNNSESIGLCPPGGDQLVERLADMLGRDPVPLAGGEKTVDIVAIIDEARCIGCTHCRHACPVDAISGAHQFMHTVIASECTGCELCVAPCPVDCISMVRVA